MSTAANRSDATPNDITGDNTGGDELQGDPLYSIMKEAFGQCVNKDGSVAVALACDAAIKLAPVYDRVFGAGYVSTYLQADLLTHAKGAKAAVDCKTYPDGKESTKTYIKRLVDQHGVEALRTGYTLGPYNFVWLCRSLTFILDFLQNSIIKMCHLPVYDGATAAYNESLRPFHGMVVSTVVSMAFTLCPTRESLLENLGFGSMEVATERLSDFLSTARPVVNAMREAIEEFNVNFPDKV
eukprot:Lankesteria_metandrocarpae@DN4941_c0_g1_i1.p1